MNDNTLIEMVALVPNVNYTDTSDPDIPKHFHWKHRGDTQEMTLAQVRTMFNQKLNYKNWLMPTNKEVIRVLGLSEEHYVAIQEKYKRNRVEFETSAWEGICNG